MFCCLLIMFFVVYCLLLPSDGIAGNGGFVLSFDNLKAMLSGGSLAAFRAVGLHGVFVFPKLMHQPPVLVLPASRPPDNQPYVPLLISHGDCRNIQVVHLRLLSPYCTQHRQYLSYP